MRRYRTYLAVAGPLSAGAERIIPRATMVTASIGLGFLITFYYQRIFGTLSGWTFGQVSGLAIARREAARLLSGSFIPLWFFPPWAFDIAGLLPFQAMYHTPLSILIGKIEGGEALRAIAVQAVWIAGFALLAHVIWRRGVRKLVVHGG